MHSSFMRGLIIIGAVIIISCEQRSEVTLPSDEVLINLVYDLHLAEASMNRVNAAKQDSVAEILRNRIADSYSITPDQMDAWLEILQKSPDHLITVYDSVIVRYERQAQK